MFDASDDTKARRPRRIEVISSPERRRDWPDERKVEIVAETLAPGVNISEIARRHEINPQQLFGWRKRFRVQAEALLEAARGTTAAARLPLFAPVLIEAPVVPEASPTLPTRDDAGGSAIEVTVGGATLRIRGAADAKTLALVLKALKVLA
jgi:transposase